MSTTNRVLDLNLLVAWLMYAATPRRVEYLESVHQWPRQSGSEFPLIVYDHVTWLPKTGSEETPPCIWNERFSNLQTQF